MTLASFVIREKPDQEQPQKSTKFNHKVLDFFGKKGCNAK